MQVSPRAKRIAIYVGIIVFGCAATAVVQFIAPYVTPREIPSADPVSTAKKEKKPGDEYSVVQKVNLHRTENTSVDLVRLTGPLTTTEEFARYNQHGLTQAMQSNGLEVTTTEFADFEIGGVTWTSFVSIAEGENAAVFVTLSHVDETGAYAVVSATKAPSEEFVKTLLGTAETPDPAAQEVLDAIGDMDAETIAKVRPQKANK